MQGAHAILAHFGGPHWLLDDEDAKNYAKAVNNVARHYEIAAAQKTIDILNLVGMAAFIEGTRILASRQGGKKPAESPPFSIAPVFQFTPPPPAADPGEGQLH